MKTYWIFLVTATLAFFNAGIIWFTEIAVYPLWPMIGALHFHAYHSAWWHSVWITFLPVGLMLLGNVGMLWLRPSAIPRWTVWLGVALQIAVHLLTIFYWAPIQAHMATPQGLSMYEFHELMATHWLRVGLYWAVAFLMLWMLAKTLELQKGSPAKL